MAHREWNDLPDTTHYTIKARDGWELSMNHDGTVTLKCGKGRAAASAATSMTINPDPGSGTPVPPA